MEMKDRAEKLVYNTQTAICDALSKIDGSSFQDTKWERPGGGGGLTRLIEGDVFEKGGVNCSTVYGTMPKTLQEQLGLSLPHGDLTFFATGISLVIHPKNPHIPTVHANYRYFEVHDQNKRIDWWFGGGADLTPYILDESDAIHFHTTHKEACDKINPIFYPQFKKACDEYFYLPHRKEHRGIGGIFFMKQSKPDEEICYQLIESCSEAFLKAYLPIVEKQINKAFTKEEKDWQLFRRGRYVEFNLLYDVGTSFGLKSNGRTESILMSLPPVVEWKSIPTFTNPQQKLMDVLTHPVDWVSRIKA